MKHRNESPANHYRSRQHFTDLCNGVRHVHGPEYEALKTELVFEDMILKVRVLTAI